MCKDGICKCKVCTCNTEVFIFDLDDTLVECQVNYLRVLAKYITEIVEHFGRFAPHPIDITAKQSKRDIELIEEYGYQKERFPQGLVDTYEYFHRKIYGNEDYDKDFKKKILELGCSIFKVIPNEIPHSIELLEFLQKEGKILYLLTAGDKDVQEYKIKNTRIHKYFPEDQIFINPRKGEAEYIEVLNHIKKKHGHIKKENIYIIGDSLRNDIRPAIELGLNAVHVDVATWHYNNIDVEEEYLTVKDLSELKNMLKKKSLKVV